MERLINGETTTSNKKRKTTTTTPQSSPIPSLPDDLLMVIIARVPILFYPILSLVSKSFRSLLASPRLYKIPSLLGLRESRLYLCINMYPYKNGPSWFTLCRKPNRTLSNKEEEKSSGYVLARIPIPHSPIAQSTSLVAVGSDIYNIGVVQSFDKASSSNVSILDCQAPSLPVELCTVTATLLDQKIYVAGLYKEDVSDSLKNSLTVLDTKTHICDPHAAWHKAAISP
ncbi:F-box/kelch-repeat protein [Cardamine amara subsp. amara]|uniref:F-box/kelch-repeat protein n=1 Tax=Cardamine amara subsp. amara TaxID=228776 RepID=A0ABD1A656_CARAN